MNTVVQIIGAVWAFMVIVNVFLLMFGKMKLRTFMAFLVTPVSIPFAIVLRLLDAIVNAMWSFEKKVDKLFDVFD